VLNRTARVMAAGHGGQILVAASTAAVVAGIDLVDRGEHRLRDLSGVEHLYQVRAQGLRVEFAPLRTLDAVPGNLPVQTTSFVGRDVAVKELCELVRAHRLVTLTGVGGVGKTRLAVQAAAELTGEFPDGVWLVELAPLGDPSAVPDVVATVLGVTAQAGLSLTASLMRALSGRRLLVVLDNCEHLLDAAADLVEELLTHTSTVRVITTSREGLRVGAEQLWSVPSLDVREGVASAAVALFVERAQAVNPTFGLDDDADAAAVTEICIRLDGIALAIELAAARMVSMSAQDVRDRLDDRFRLLAGARRRLERHQTLRQAVGWSFDLLDVIERAFLRRCSVFAGGFDAAAAVAVCSSGQDEYAVLDLLDSLVRKSLVTIERRGGTVRYGLLETIRQFAAEELAATGTTDDVRDRHAAYFAAQVVTQFDASHGPRLRFAVDWLDTELANLRTGFRWAVARADLKTAAAIAAHATMLGFQRQRFEPAGWAEEILEAATDADVAHLPRLFTAASVCAYTGRPEAAVAYAQTAIALEDDDRYDPFTADYSPRIREAEAHRFAGRNDQRLAIYRNLAARPGRDGSIGLSFLLYVLPEVGLGPEARTIADEALAAARSFGQPTMLAYTLHGYGRAFAETDPQRALSAMRQALAAAREHGLGFFEALFARDLASIEAAHGDRDQALRLFDTAIEAFYRAGNDGSLGLTLAYLTVFLDDSDQPSVAATVYGASTRYAAINTVTKLPSTVEHVRLVLGDDMFEQCVAAGAAMEPADATAYARDQIRAGLDVWV
jgi:predicted ATPase